MGGQRAAPDVDGNGSGTRCAHMDQSTHTSSQHMDKQSLADPRPYRSLAEPPRPYVSTHASTPLTFVSPDMSMHMGGVPQMTLNGFPLNQNQVTSTACKVTSTHSRVTPDTSMHMGGVPRMTLTSTHSPVTPDTSAHLQTAFQPLKRRGFSGVNYLF